MNANTKIQKMLSILAPVALFLLWFVLTNYGIIKPLYFPKPQAVFSSILDLKGTLVFHILATLTRVIIGYVLGVLVGLFLGLAMSYNKYMFASLNTIIESWRPVPPVALVPFFILWFGFSNTGKIVLVLFGVALIIVVNTIEAVKNVNPIYVQAAYSLGAAKRKVFFSVIFPAIIPELRSGLRIALALSVSLVIVSEFLGASIGIGYLINISKITFNTNTILLSALILGLISWLLDFILRKILDRATLWKETSSEALEN